MKNSIGIESMKLSRGIERLLPGRHSGGVVSRMRRFRGHPIIVFWQGR